MVVTRPNYKFTKLHVHTGTIATLDLAMALRLSYQVFGSHSKSKSPVLIFHGMFGSGNNWRSLGKKIASEVGTTVYALDARNHGNSGQVSQMDYHLMSRDALEFCKEHHLEKVSLIGHSMGGKTAMVLALDNPGLVDKLAVVDVSPTSSPGTSTGETEDLVQAMESLDLLSLKDRREADLIIQPRIPNVSIREFILANLIRAPSNGGWKWRFNLQGIAENIHVLKDFPATTSTFDGPTLFIGGERSNYIPKGNSKNITNLFPAAAITHIAGAGHWLHVENPKDFLLAITRLLN